LDFFFLPFSLHINFLSATWLVAWGGGEFSGQIKNNNDNGTTGKSGKGHSLFYKISINLLSLQFKKIFLLTKFLKN
jgi:hypothetical protein